MSHLLYYAIADSFTSEEVVLIDIEVRENRKKVYLFIRKLPRKSKKLAKKITKKIGVSVLLIISILPICPSEGRAIPITPSTNNYQRLICYDNKEQNKLKFTQIAYLPEAEDPKIRFTETRVQKYNRLIFQLETGSLTTKEVIAQLRCGDIWDALGIFFYVYILFIHNHCFPTEAFNVQPPQNINPFDYFTGRLVKNKGPLSTDTGLKLMRPPEVSHYEYQDMTKLQRRRLRDVGGRDVTINVNDYPELDIAFGQMLHKTPPHGDIYDLFVDKNGRTPKTEENAKAIRDKIVEIAHNPETIWYLDGKYQPHTDRCYQTINLYEPKTGRIVVFEKLPEGRNSFLTTCRLEDLEHKHLESTNGNFTTKKTLELLNWKPSETMLNTTNTLDELVSPNPDFTLINSFESDVMSITPRNPDW